MGLSVIEQALMTPFSLSSPQRTPDKAPPLVTVTPQSSHV